jgi:hypothetical protein
MKYVQGTCCLYPQDVVSCTLSTEAESLFKTLVHYLHQTAWCHIAEEIYLTAILLQHNRYIAVVKFRLLQIVNKFYLTVSCLI